MRDFEKRFLIEYYELDDRITKLEKMILSYENKTIGFTMSSPITLHKKQLEVMKTYRSILRERAELENVHL